jgi:hypothetical protein
MSEQAHRVCNTIKALALDNTSCFDTVQNTVGIPVAQMDDAYSQETLALAEDVDRYASMDVYDSERPKLVGVSNCSMLLRNGAGQIPSDQTQLSTALPDKRRRSGSRKHSEMQPSCSFHKFLNTDKALLYRPKSGWCCLVPLSLHHAE